MSSITESTLASPSSVPDSVRAQKHHSQLMHRIGMCVDNIKPYILHFVMVLGVTAYVFIGAYTIRHIEATKTGFITKADRILENVGRTRHHDQPPPQYERVTERFKRKTNLHRARKCVQIAMKRLASGECDPNNLISPTHPVFLELDECYKRDVQEKVKRAMNDAEAETATPIVEPLQSKNSTTTEWEYWSLKDSILFCFTVITTIGYGNVAPQTFNGQLFVIIYGLIGVPFAMLVIANLGKFLAELLKAINKKMYKCARAFFCCRRASKQTLLPKIDENANECSEEVEETVQSGAIGLFLAFIIYNILGSIIISSYEPEMDFFKAIYFNFVTLTTIGLGDIIPQSGEYLAFTLLYVALGLALTSIAIEIAADYLKKLHYFGRKIDNVAQVTIWFGSQKLTMKQLVRNLGDQFNLPVNEMDELNLEKFVDDAIKVETGEIPTLRNPNAIRPIFITDFKNPFKQGRVLYVDEDDRSSSGIYTADVNSLSRHQNADDDPHYQYQPLV
ncbi:unnamed protein product [Bursaphelenchus xylophilus]|uniref:(pine wood nematode) hypothetical protein n=1 Tax=Bursaphelenchus xylophilus TaxID=6326 RepID=A0A7I8WYH5_BURXY|nr:unnamed protein product [Bursaphelenchus xylophilus]CAG9101175.1 unnamed protein product [Bursaphelenchus xylophilus]